MKNLRAWAAAVIGCALLVACGGGDETVPGSGSPSGAPTTKGSFSAVVVFGDSLSDIGTYAPATSLTGDGRPPYFGGKFTTNDLSSNNGTLGKVWAENLAIALGIPMTPAEVGFAGVSQKCPATTVNPALASTCTAYAQGGSRVTSPNGIGHVTATGAPAALTVPTVTQIANHLAAFGSFKASDLVLVWSGNNEVFYQLGVFGAAAAQIQADAAAGRLTADQTKLKLFDAQTQAQYALKQAALELAGYVRDQILAKGAKYVVVLNAVDSSMTPFGNSAQVAPVRSVLITLVETFNLWLRDGLTDQPVELVDVNPLLRAAIANPASAGFVNVTTPACDVAKIALITTDPSTGVPLVDDGSSLACNATPGAPFNGLSTGADATTWLFADAKHPSTGGHKVLGDFITQQLKAFGWI